MAQSIRAVEINFPMPVVLDGDTEQFLVSVADRVCKAWEAEHPDRTAWPAGIGGKLLCHPMMLSDDEPMPVDMEVFAIDCHERENFDWPCAKCGHPQGDHQGLILNPPAGDCDYQPKEKPVPETPTYTASPIMKYFSFDHLPDDLKEASRTFHATASWVDQNLPGGAEKATALRKLLEGKDAAVRAALDKRG